MTNSSSRQVTHFDTDFAAVFRLQSIGRQYVWEAVDQAFSMLFEGSLNLASFRLETWHLHSQILFVPSLKLT